MRTTRKIYSITSPFTLGAKPRIFRCRDQFGNADAPDDLPTEVRFGKGGYIEKARWANGRCNPDHPSTLHFDPQTGKLIGAEFKHRAPDGTLWPGRNNGKPCYISIDPVTGFPGALDFKVHGEYWRPDGKPPEILFGENGDHTDSENNPVDALDDFRRGWLDDFPKEGLIDSSRNPFFDVD